MCDWVLCSEHEQYREKEAIGLSFDDVPALSPPWWSTTLFEVRRLVGSTNGAGVACVSKAYN